MQDWSHLQDIEGSTSGHLSGKLIGIGASGSIACVELHRLARTLIRHGAKVQFFLTEAAAQLASPRALAWSTGREPIITLTARCEHLEYFGEHGSADLLLLAPTTANTLGKVANGLDDNIVTTCVTTALGMGVPVLCAPGMHEPMMRNPAVLANLKKAEEYGIEILQPTLAEGKQKMMGVAEMVARVLRRLGPQDLRGRRVLITGGPTREFLDPARCLTNPSSGLTACLLAEEAYRRGAEVRLIYGPGKESPSPWHSVDKVVSCQDMVDAVESYCSQGAPDIAVACAAVSDFKPAVRSDQKIKTADGGFHLELAPTPKVVERLRELAPEAKIVSFKAASTDDDNILLELMKPYLNRGISDLVVGNSMVVPGQGFDSKSNRYLVAGKTGEPQVLGPAAKAELVKPLWDLFINL